MESTESAVQFLRDIGRHDLAALLVRATYQLVERESRFRSVVTGIEVSAPQIYADAMFGLLEWDKKRIAEAIHTTHVGSKPGLSVPDRIDFTVSIGSESGDNLYPELVIHRNQMIAVSTGQGRIQDLDDYYRARHRRITAQLNALGIENPNTYESLWDWYHKWKADFGSYAERRKYINDLYRPLLEQLVNVQAPAVQVREPTGWERADRTLEKAHAQMRASQHEEDFQTVGLLCREVLISLGQAVYDSKIHTTIDGVRPSATDAGRMVEAFLSATVAGSTNENVRRHARAALQLAVELQHKRTADFRVAALCLEATASISNIIAILCGRRDPEGDGVRLT